MRDKITHLIEKAEQTIDHLKFWLSPMPTSVGFMDSLQVDMIERKWNWYPTNLPMFDKFLFETFLPGCRMLLNSESKLWRRLSPDYVPKYWETTKIDVKRTIARMSRNGGIW